MNTTEQVLDYAECLRTAGDCYSDECIVALADEVRRLRAENAALRDSYNFALADWAEDHTHLQQLCLAAGVSQPVVDGDSHAVPGIMELADLLDQELRNMADSVASDLLALQGVDGFRGKSLADYDAGRKEMKT